MKSVLLLGQSNMAGRGFLHETAPICNERIFMLRNGRWQMMAEPIHFDRSVAGAGPAASFAECWCNANKNQRIGLIPCAEGGSSIDQWNPKGTLFRHAVSEAGYAMESSDLIAVLWHQGESDSQNGGYREYYKKLDEIVKALRERLGIENLPVVLGGLGDYLGKSGFGAGCVEFDLINREILRYAEHNKDCYFVTGKDLYPNPDGIHINAESQRRFGIRYFEAYYKKKHVYEPMENERRLVNALYEREHTLEEKKMIALEQFTRGKSTLEEVMKFLM